MQEEDDGKLQTRLICFIILISRNLNFLRKNFCVVNFTCAIYKNFMFPFFSMQKSTHVHYLTPRTLTLTKEGFTKFLILIQEKIVSNQVEVKCWNVSHFHEKIYSTNFFFLFIATFFLCIFIFVVQFLVIKNFSIQWWSWMERRFVVLIWMRILNKTIFFFISTGSLR